MCLSLIMSLRLIILSDLVYFEQNKFIPAVVLVVEPTETRLKLKRTKSVVDNHKQHQSTENLLELGVSFFSPSFAFEPESMSDCLDKESCQINHPT